MLTKTSTCVIIKIGKQDEFFSDRKRLIGRKGIFNFDNLQCGLPWLTGTFIPDDPSYIGERPLYFFQVQLKSI